MKLFVKIPAIAICVVLLTGFACFGALYATGHLQVAAIVSGSMDTPHGIPVGATALGWDTRSVRVGDVVTAHRPDGQLVTHRVVSVEGDQFVLKGDANKEADAGAYQVSAGVSRVFFVIPSLGRWATEIRTNLVLMIAIVLGCGMLIGHSIPRSRGSLISR